MMNYLKSLTSAAIGAALLCAGCSWIDGEFRGAPAEMEANISDGAKELLAQAFTFDAADGRLVLADHHLHAIARGTTTASRSAYLNPDLDSVFHPYLWLKTRAFMSASGVDDLDLLEQQYEKRLLDLLLHFQDVQRRYAPGAVESHFYLYALDYFHDENGELSEQYTDLHVPNDYVLDLSARLNRDLAAAADTRSRARVVPVGSVHPYRRDYRRQLAWLAERGVRYIKWLPSSMNIDPEKVPAGYYREMAERDMVLLTHTGREHAMRVKTEAHQHFSSPEKLRPALDCGVPVVALHSARRGRHPDTGATYFDGLMRLMALEEYKDTLFSEISVMLLGRKVAGDSRHFLVRLMEKAGEGGPLHNRVINGSDYPVPALTFLNPTEGLAERDMISKDEQRWLDEIFGYNRLLFDFVAKRTLRHPKTRRRLPEEFFFPLDTKRKVARASEDCPRAAPDGA